MPELRQNVITRDWVVIATERSRRPDQFVKDKSASPPVHRHDQQCPFCVGNEGQTQAEIYSLRDERGWKVRVVQNKFPALSPQGDRIRKIDGIYRSMSGVGVHEVVVEHPRHDMTPALMSIKHVADILRVYQHRYAEIRKDPRVEAIIIFKNHGEAAGTSLLHPHSQIAATPVVPNQFRLRMDEAIRFFDDTGQCVFCQTLEEELTGRDRIVCETEHFVTFVPYAALSPFHMWIFPRRHTSSFDGILHDEIRDLGKNLKTVLAKLYIGLGNPDYNYSIRSIPTRFQQSEFFHWYVTIIPRISRTAGFELGSGMFINSTLPEESAQFLRGVSVPD